MFIRVHTVAFDKQGRAVDGQDTPIFLSLSAVAYMERRADHTHVSLVSRDWLNIRETPEQIHQGLANAAVAAQLTAHGPRL